jgi:two-component system LytT family sensor kinase
VASWDGCGGRGDVVIDAGFTPGESGSPLPLGRGEGNRSEWGQPRPHWREILVRRDDLAAGGWMMRGWRWGVVLLVGAGLFSLDVLRTFPSRHLGLIVGLSFASALIKFALWAAAAWVMWRLVARWPLGGRPRLATALVHLLASLGLSAAVTVVATLLQAPLRPTLAAALPAGTLPRLIDSWTGSGRAELTAALALSLPWDLLTYWVILAGMIFWHWAAQVRARERRALDLAAEISRARLHALESQLQPHFLFNTLHTIASLIDHDRGAAVAVTRQLRDLFRRLLAAEHAPTHPLADELAFLRDYVAIQRARFGDRLRFEVEVAPGCEAAFVPSLLLQPLVENAVRHGAAQRSAPTLVRVRAWREGRDLELEVHDDGPGLHVGNPDRRKSDGSGIGLANTKQRLAHQYGQAQRFVVDAAAPPLGGLRVRITVPFELAAAARTAGPMPPDTAFPSLEVAVASERARPQLWLQASILFAAAMLVLNLVWSAARYFVFGRAAGLSLAEVFALGARGGFAFVLLFPGVYWVNQRFLARTPGWLRRFAGHAACAIALSLAKATLVRGFALALGDRVSGVTIWTLVMTRFYADILHYALMVGLCQAFDRHRRHREQTIRALRLEAELASAHLQALQLRLDPGALFATLAALEPLIERAPAQAEQLVADLGDRLRQALVASA